MSTDNPLTFGFRRRCGWCGVVLRAWQLNLCRQCKAHVRIDCPSPPCGHLSRVDEAADRARRFA